MQDHRDAALVVGDAGAVELVAVLLVGLALQDAGLVHGVHVGLQHDLLRAAAGQCADHGVGAGTDRRLAALGLEAERRQSRIEQRRQLGQTHRIGTAGLDRDQRLERFDHRRLRGLRGGEQRGVGRGTGERRSHRERCGSGHGGERAKGRIEHGVKSCGR